MSTSSIKPVSKLISMSPDELSECLKTWTIDEIASDLRSVPWPEVDVPVMSTSIPFSVSSGALRITDPAYSLTCEQAENSTGAGTLWNVKNGRWLACVETQRYASDVSRWKFWHEKGINGFVKKYHEEPDAADARFMDAMKLSWLTNILNDYSRQLPDCGPARFLHIQHADHLEPVPVTHAGYDEVSFKIEIDSGMAGFFDLDWITSQYPVPAPREPFSLAWFEGVTDEMAYSVDPVWKGFYHAACALTPAETKFGAFEHAAVAYGGDGSCRVFIRRNDEGEVVCARIVFIDHSACDQ